MSKGELIIIATDNDEINKEPARILIDRRLDKVNDWEIIEKVSSINDTIKNTSILVKNTYNRYEDTIQPKYQVYTNQLINTIIIPDRYISIILAIIIETVINSFILTIVIEYPVARSR